MKIAVYAICKDERQFLYKWLARCGDAAVGTLVLQYMPHELVGNYFMEVSECDYTTESI